MAVLYVTSSAGAVGKTTICAGLGRHLLDNGKKVGFLKLVIGDNKQTKSIDGDALFMKQILGLDEPLVTICPSIGSQENIASRVKEACAAVSKDKDVVIVEGGGCEQGIVAALDGKVIAVEGYSNGLPRTGFKNGYKDLADYLLGVVLNMVPAGQVESIAGELASGKGGLNIVGVLPEDRTLFTLSVGELAEHLGGEILNNAEKSAELVDNFMLGAMTVDSGPTYFGRKANKAAVISSRRPDMQLAALETSLKCLILSGKEAPIPAVLSRAKDKGVPIIAVKSDTLSTVTAIEDALGNARFNQKKKLPRLAEIMGKHFNFPAVYQELGLAG